MTSTNGACSACDGKGFSVGTIRAYNDGYRTSPEQKHKIPCFRCQGTGRYPPALGFGPAAIATGPCGACWQTLDVCMCRYHVLRDPARPNWHGVILVDRAGHIVERVDAGDFSSSLDEARRRVRGETG